MVFLVVGVGPLPQEVFELHCILRCYGFVPSSFSLVARVVCSSHCPYSNTDHRRLSAHFVAIKIAAGLASVAEIGSFALSAAISEEIYWFAVERSANYRGTASYSVVSFRVNVFCTAVTVGVSVAMLATA